jgi:uncharacterized membrane protein YebE (DUF533 family)
MFDAQKLLNVLAVSRALETARHGLQATESAAGDAYESSKKAARGAAKLTAGAASSVVEAAGHGLQATESAAGDAYESSKKAASDAARKAKEIVVENPGGTIATVGVVAATAAAVVFAPPVLVGMAATAGVGGIVTLCNATADFLGTPLGQKVAGGAITLLGRLTTTLFSEEAHTQESALLLVQAMVATAASDGVVDPSQWLEIVDKMKDGGRDEHAKKFLDAEFQHPATIEEIAKAVGSSKELALQVYAAAYLVASSGPEKIFLKNLAEALVLDPSLIAQVNQIALLDTAPTQ